MSDVASDATTAPPGGSIARAGVRSVTVLLIVAFVELLVTFVTARGFGAAGRGLYALASTATTLIVTILGGVSSALANEFVHRRASARAVHAVGLLIALGGGSAIALLMVVARWIVPDVDSLDVIALGAIAAIFGLLSGYQQMLLNAADEVSTTLSLRLLSALAPLAVLSVAALTIPDRPLLAIAWWSVALAFAPLCGVVVIRRRYGFDFNGARSLARRALRSGFVISLANGTMRAFSRVDLLVLAALAPLTAVGIYSVAIAGAESVFLLSNAVITAAFSRMLAIDDESDSQVVTVRAIRHSVLLVAVGASVAVPAVAVFAGPVFGSGFADVWKPLAVLVPGIVALAAIEVMRNVLFVRDSRAREFLVMAGVGLAVNGALAFALIPWLGSLGAALSSTIAYVLCAAALLGRYARRNTLGSARAFLPGRAEFNAYVDLYRAARRGGAAP